jgi:hypothetical protein
MFLPGIIFLLALSIIRLGSSRRLPLKPKVEPYLSDEDYFFSQEINNTKVERDYTSLKKIMKNMTVIVNEEGRCNDVTNFIKEETNFTVNCSYALKDTYILHQGYPLPNIVIRHER